MPSTIKEIAEATGVTKQTVRNRLKSLGLWDHHVTAGDTATPAVVDDEATQIVVAALTGKRQPVTEAPQLRATPPVDAEAAMARERALYEARIADLRDRIVTLEGEKIELQKQVKEAGEAIKLLPSPTAVVEARAEGERAGREAARAAGLWDRLLGRF